MFPLTRRSRTAMPLWPSTALIETTQSRTGTVVIAGPLPEIRRVTTFALLTLDVYFFGHFNVPRARFGG